MVMFRLLGPVGVYVAGRPLNPGPPQQRAVLAALLVDAGRPVLPQDLISRVWDGVPPTAARQSLYAYITRIRRLLEQVATNGGEQPVALVRRSSGYLVEIEVGKVDLHLFADLTTSARDTRCSDADRARLLGQALDLWRGAPLADLPGEWAARMRVTWQQRKLDVVVAWAEANLRIGHHREVIDPILDLLADHPMSEHLVGALMHALVAAGRGAEALDRYAAFRANLVDELGAEPGADLRAIHEAVLRGELDRPTGEPAKSIVAGQPSSRAPAQLPAEVHSFTGRTDELAGLDLLTTGAGRVGQPSTGMMITVIAGTAGVGKTALAVHWAHLVRDQFSDGQLYVNLRGYHPDQPMDPGDALTRFLTALGIAGHEVPSDLDDRAARYRTEVAGKRMLIVLDNAATPDQVRPLLPGSRTCLVLITSRDSLSGLVIIDGAQRLDLDLLPLPDAVALLRRLIGVRAQAEPEAVVTLAELCARLPLALRISAELANTNPSAPLADLVIELADRHQRLDLLDTIGDPHAAVRAVFSWSYEQLEPDIARTFRLLGPHPGPDLDAHSAAALSNNTVNDARRHLSALTRVHLVHSNVRGRYGMHDLLRSYATHRAIAEDTEADVQAALTRLLDHYRDTAVAAVDLLYPFETINQSRGRLPASSATAFDNQTDAAIWLDIEHANLLAAAVHASDHGWPNHAITLAAILNRHLLVRGAYTDALTLHTQVLDAARSTCSRDGELTALCGLGDIHLVQGRHGPAGDCYQQALTIARQTGDRISEFTPLVGLGTIDRLQGRHGPARDCFQQALTIARQIDHRNSETIALNRLGDIHLVQGQYGPARDYYQQALTISRQTGNRSAEYAFALYNLGDIHRLEGRYGPAADCYQQVLTIARQTGNCPGELYAVHALGHIHRLEGRFDLAASCFAHALSVARDIGERNGQFEALYGLAHTFQATGSADLALTHHQRALELADELDQPPDQARAHHGLATAHLALGNTDRARRHWLHSLDILTTLGHTHAEDIHTDDIRARLADLDHQQPGRA